MAAVSRTLPAAHDEEGGDDARDLAGARIRTGGGQLSEIVKALGAVPVALSVPETYNALERGVVDGTILPYEAAKAFKLAEVTKHVVDVRIFTASQFTVMNLDKYNALPADLRKVIDELAASWGAEFAGTAWDKAEEEGLAAIKAAGLQHHKISDAQRGPGRTRPKRSRRNGSHHGGQGPAGQAGAGRSQGAPEAYDPADRLQCRRSGSSCSRGCFRRPRWRPARWPSSRSPRWPL